jgi:hypothetical protein
VEHEGWPEFPSYYCFSVSTLSRSTATQFRRAVVKEMTNILMVVVMDA